MGAKRISEYLLDINQLPKMVITIDVTSLIGEQKGIALYSDHWDISRVSPSGEMVAVTRKLQRVFKSLYPDIRFLNNPNDYTVYGRLLSENSTKPIPSIALEPAVYPYHQPCEGIFLSDVRAVENILITFLEQYDFKILPG
jgi:hypothetical protein